MTGSIRCFVAQINPTVGDLAGNAKLIVDAWEKALQSGADIVIAPELCVTGYPLDDFALNPDLQKGAREVVSDIAARTASGPAIVVGAPWKEEGKLFNAALLLDGGEVKSAAFKRDLPNYGCFDEKRIFAACADCAPMRFRKHNLGVMICEDMWTPETSAELKAKGAEILIAINGSPFEPDKQNLRYKLAKERTAETGLPLIYANMVGGQDDLVFEGGSFAMSSGGELQCLAPMWKEDATFVECDLTTGSFLYGEKGRTEICADEAAYCAVMTGLRDYVRKNGFKNVVLGLSGGIDSALVAVMAADALGASNVRAFMMPSPYTSRESLDDAVAMAKNLGIRLANIPIDGAMEVFDSLLSGEFIGCPKDATEENIQARIRGLLLMALSNKGGALTLATGNKSEMAVGYATLYGDMCGGYAPLKDVYKTQVYKLARWRNANIPEGALGRDGELIGENILKKAPTAELRHGQRDEDSLPPYETLDAILRCLVEEDMSLSDMAFAGFDASVVKRVSKMLAAAEHKRRQSPPGPKITKKHLSKDRRYPITNRR